MKPQSNMPKNNMPQSTAHQFSSTILREYDIRGQVGKNLSEQDAYYLGRAFATFLKRTHNAMRVCVGYDGRQTSPGMAQALIKGLNESGADVELVGLGPTPMLYFAVKDRGADAGIMITGSHNPSDYNGFKMTLQKQPIFGQTILEIGAIAAAGDFESGEGSLSEIDIQDEYVTRLIKDLTNERPLKIGWDNGNGAAGEILRRLTAQLPGEHILLYDDIDGGFPNHHPDPTVDENLVDLQALVKEHGCDLGIAFDGDGDRIGVVDEHGTVLRCDILMTIYADEVLSTHPGAPIIGDIKCSQVMFDKIDQMGGQGIVWKTGHSLIKSKMAELNAPLAGELSGHIFFADKYYGYDDALYCAVRLINALKSPDGGLSSLTADLPKLFNTPELRIEVDEEIKFDIVPKMIESIKAQDIDYSEIDGVRVSTEDGWWLVRPSNTQNALVARIEATSEDGLTRLKNMAAGELEKAGYPLAL